MGRWPRDRRSPHRGHLDPAGHHPARPRRSPGADVAVVPPPRRRPGTWSAPVAGLPAAFRPRARVPVPQAPARLGKPLLRDPAAADRWTWLIIACMPSCTSPAAARRRPPALAAAARPPGPRMTPGRVHAGFRRARRSPARPPARETGTSRPRTPRGSKNKRTAPRHPVGKTRPKTRANDKKARKKTKPTG